MNPEQEHTGQTSRCSPDHHGFVAGDDCPGRVTGDDICPDVDTTKVPSPCRRELDAEGQESARQLMEAVQARDNDRVKTLLGRGAYLPDFLTDRLHVAVKLGYRRIVSMLLVARADANTVDSEGTLPLAYAIQHDRYVLVKMLVRHGAKLFNTRMCSEHCSNGSHLGALFGDPGDLLFVRSNTVAIVAAAEGLKDNPEQVQDLEPRQLVQFLNAAGSAPRHIIQALFVKRVLAMPMSIWKESVCMVDSGAHGGDEEELIDIDTAQIGTSGLSVAEGPEARTLRNGMSRMTLDSSNLLSDEHVEFLAKLAPQKKRRSMFSTSGSEVPINIFQCLIPAIADDIHVLAAIAKTSDVEIFDDPGCQAIVKLAWRKARPFNWAMFSFQLSNEVALCGLTDSLHESPVIPLPVGPQAWAAVCVATWIPNGLEEVAEAVGFFELRHGYEYITDVANIFDWLRLAVRGFVMCHLAFGGEGQSMTLRSLLALVVLWTWVRILFFLRVTKTLGTRVLPILDSVSHIGAFVIVVAFCLASFIHMYWVLAYENPLEATMLVFRLAMMGDFDQEEMDERLPEFWTYIFIIVLGFVMCITILNIFIGVLGLAYEDSCTNAHRSFVREQANVALSIRAAVEGLSVLAGRRLRCWGGNGAVKVASETTESDQSYRCLWYACRAEEQQYKDMANRELEFMRDEQELRSMLDEQSRASRRPPEPAAAADLRVDKLAETVSGMSRQLERVTQLVEAISVRVCGTAGEDGCLQ